VAARCSLRKEADRGRIGVLVRLAGRIAQEYFGGPNDEQPREIADKIGFDGQNVWKEVEK
jgi:hypothetical protein